MLLFTESFDMYADQGSPNRPLRKWSASRNSGGANFIAEGLGRFGNGFSGGERWAYKDLGVNAPTLIAGIAVRCDDTSTMQIMSFWDGTTCHLDLVINANLGTILLYRNRSEAPGTLLASIAIPGFALTAYNYYELKATIHDTLGAYEVKVNGVTVLSASGVDTRNGANAYANRFRLAASNDLFATWYWDDVYVCDGIDSGITGAPNNDFLGDVRIEVIFPNANGTTSDFDGSDGNSTDNYLLVDETSPNDDTDYVTTTVLNEKDTYNYGSLVTTNGFVYGAISYLGARKTDAGTRQVCNVARSGTTEVDGDNHSIGTSYSYYSEVWEADPDTGDAWDIAGINAAQFGMKVTV